MSQQQILKTPTDIKGSGGIIQSIQTSTTSKTTFKGAPSLGQGKCLWLVCNSTNTDTSMQGLIVPPISFLEQPPQWVIPKVQTSSGTINFILPYKRYYESFVHKIVATANISGYIKSSAIASLFGIFEDGVPYSSVWYLVPIIQLFNSQVKSSRAEFLSTELKHCSNWSDIVFYVPSENVLQLNPRSFIN